MSPESEVLRRFREQFDPTLQPDDIKAMCRLQMARLQSRYPTRRGAALRAALYLWWRNPRGVVHG